MRPAAVTRFACYPLALLFAARTAAARAPVPPMTDPPAPPLLQIKDDRQRADALHAIAHDPALAIDDPAARGVALAVMTEGVRQWQQRAYDQALANFLDAYARLGSPRVLPPIAVILRDMGRLADAANTYQRYLSDPANRGERVAELTELLDRLDEQLTLLTVQVAPAGAEISIDGGPFIAVGDALVTRVGAGLHLVRIRNDGASDERTIHGFEGETKTVALQLPAGAPPPSPPPPRVEGWLVTGTHYGAGDARGRARTVLGPGDRAVIAAVVPADEVVEHTEPLPAPIDDDDASWLEFGAVGAIRIDGKGRGFAGGLGLTVSRGRLDVELMVLRSDELGGYLGARYRLLRGRLSPYLAAGIPGFVFDHTEELPVPDSAPIDPEVTTRLAIGARAAAGVELRVNHYVSVYADLGYEHFFFADDGFEADLFVPTVAMVGRL